MSNKSTGPKTSFIGNAANCWLCIFVLLYIYPLTNGLLSFGLLSFGTRLAVDFLAYYLLPLLVFVTLRIFNRDALKEFYGELETSDRGIAVSAVIGCALAYTLRSLVILSSSSVTPGSGNWHQLLIGQYGFLAVIYLSAAAGFVEEFLYKAILFRAIAASRFESPGYFVILSAALFGAAHQEQGIAPVVIYTIFYGLPSAYYYLRVRNLANLIVVHLVADICLFGGLV